MQVMIVVSTLFGVSVAFVVLRVASKLISRTFCTEDYFVIAATVFAVVPLTTVLYSKSLHLFSSSRHLCIFVKEFVADCKIVKWLGLALAITYGISKMVP